MKGVQRSEHSMWAFREMGESVAGKKRERYSWRKGAYPGMRAPFDFQNSGDYILKGMRNEYGILVREMK